MTRKEAFIIASEVESIAKLTLTGILPGMEVGGIISGLLNSSKKVGEELAWFAEEEVLSFVGLGEGGHK